VADIKVPVPTFDKLVTVSVPDGEDLAAAFNEASLFIQTLVANNKIRDRELNVDPKGATHEIVKDGHGGYALRRMRFDLV
jgi:hypothetical protein